MEKKSYLGTGWAFPPAFIKGSGVVMASEEEDIAQSLRILFSTRTGERVFRYDYGNTIRQWLFGQINPSEETMIKESVKQAIIRCEPRIEVEAVTLRKEDLTDGILRIELDYWIPQVNSRSNKVFPFYFKEGTHL